MRRPRWLATGLVLTVGALAPQATGAAGLIVNEISNGPSGTKEYFELLVVGDTSSPLAPLDLDGWIVDDNNGSWGGGGSGKGIAQGYAVFDTQTDPANCGGLASVPPGSIILVYNGADPAPGVPAVDLNDANGDSVYVLTLPGNCIIACRPNPSATNSGYTIPCVPRNIQSWAPLHLRNRGDAAQTRDPAGTLYHGFAYGDINPPYPANSFNIHPATGAQQSYIFSCGSWYHGANFSRISQALGTPGDANNAANTTARARIADGTFNYLNPADPLNCSVLPDLLAVKFLQMVEDPVNGTTNPKGIPGSSALYTVAVTNEGNGAVDSDTVMLTDAVPAETEMFVGNLAGGSPIRFIDGSPASGLSFTFTNLGSTTDGVEFSNDGGTTFSYTPAPDAQGYDPAVTTVRILPDGTFAASNGTNHPQFSVQFKVRVR